MLSALLAPALKWISGGLLIACLILGGLWQIEKRGHAKANARIVQLTQLRKIDRANYEAAQRAADAKNKADVQRIEAEQERITHDSQSNLADRLELIRRELRKPQAVGGSAGGSSVSQDGQAPCRAFDPAWMCVSPEERLHAAESEERHDELIDWVTRQSEVR